MTITRDVMQLRMLTNINKSLKVMLQLTTNYSSHSNETHFHTKIVFHNGLTKVRVLFTGLEVLHFRQEEVVCLLAFFSSAKSLFLLFFFFFCFVIFFVIIITIIFLFFPFSFFFKRT